MNRIESKLLAYVLLIQLLRISEIYANFAGSCTTSNNAITFTEEAKQYSNLRIVLVKMQHWHLSYSFIHSLKVRVWYNGKCRGKWIKTTSYRKLSVLKGKRATCTNERTNECTNSGWRAIEITNTSVLFFFAFCMRSSWKKTFSLVLLLSVKFVAIHTRFLTKPEIKKSIFEIEKQ